uniref:Integrase catalytic domain-containing protein n=1 Tax=Panagrolaimus sp. PS1159 TaxID=55785 RepID=A0AC35FD49_9BILA
MTTYNRLFDSLDNLVIKITTHLNEYKQMLLVNPRPWSNEDKANIRPYITRLKKHLKTWNETLDKLETKASHMRNDDTEKQTLFDRIDSWNNDEAHDKNMPALNIQNWNNDEAHDNLKDDLEITIAQGQEYLDLVVEQVFSTPNNTVVQELATPPSLKMPALNIQKFDGNYLSYNSFWQRFKYLVHDQNYPKVEKLITLYGLLDGKALKAVEGFQMVEENYDTVIQILADRFGNQNRILQELHAKLRATPRARPTAQSMRETVDSINKICRELKNFGVDIENDSTRLDIIDKMPPREKDELSYMNIATPRPSTDAILQKMDNMVIKAEISSKNRFFENNQSTLSLFPQQRRFDHSTSPNSSYNNTKPVGFKPVQSTYSNRTPENDSSKKFVCSLCEEIHPAANCPTYVTVQAKLNQLKAKNYCTKCARRSHITKQCQTNVCCRTCDGHHYTFLCDTNKNSKETTDAVVFFDPGSQRSFVSDCLIRQLKLPRENQEILNLQGIGAKATNYTSSLIKIQIKTTEAFEEIYANSIPKIANSVAVVEFSGIDTKGISVTNHPPDILIGMDYFFHFITSFEKQNDIVIVHSKVGQMLSGNIQTVTNTTISALAIEPQQFYNYDDELQNFWKLEAMGIKDQELESNETEILEKFKESIKFKDNRFFVSWPTKPEHKPLPTNAGLSVGRLNSTLKKLQHDPKLLNEYQKTFDNQLKLGKIEIAPEIPQGGIVHYLPHHAVITPQKSTTKVRMVFDGSAKCSKDAPSLNDCFVRGPLKIPDICGMLMRIRTSKYLLMGDIEKAFHQVYLNEKDRDAVRFFWVKDPSKPASGDNLIVYRFVAVPFGIISSPFILWIIIIILIQKLENPQLRQMIAENTYVDNIFLTTNDEQEGIEYFQETKKHFLTASMNVREWLSNSKIINEAFPSEIKQQGPITKILGIQWNSQEDTLTLQLKTEKLVETWTKRSILKFIASTFDPLGMLSPVTIKGKVFLQKLFKQGIPWDTPLKQKLQDEWQLIKNSWTGEIKIPRKIVHGTMQENDFIEIHTFADASLIAYCACVFVRIKTSMGYETSLIFAKTKLQPLNKNLTIPKMEIMGIWLGAKISSFVAKELKLETAKKFIWTDSQISVFWSKKWPKDVFVTNRLKDVVASKAELMFVPGKLNPADLGTRGIDVDELQKANCWWHGPSFLKQDEESWPKLPQNGIDLTQTISALVATNTLTLQNIEIQREFEINTNLSWIELKKQIAMKEKNVESEEDLTAEDLMQVENMLIKQEQQIFVSPQTEKHLKLTKNEDGIYVINTRFDHADLINPHPFFLPKDSPITKMIVMDIHKKLHHSGIPHTLSKVREKYWIPSGRVNVQKIIRKCKTCKIWKGTPFALPNMPQLPSSRINKSIPFQNTGIDYCGPFKIKGQKEKAWIILFTCFTTRLIHLEPVTSMASVDFLQSFRRFLSRRGIPHYVLSDNAKQFKTTATALDKIWAESIQDKEAINFFNENGITWDFITERAPWKGGLYERLVSLVKNSIKQTLGHRVLDFNEFWTFLIEVESTVNSRPLTYVHATESFVIRPIDFITPKIEIRLPPTPSDNRLNDSTYLPSNTAGGECLAERYFKTVQYLDRFWELWSKDYLNLLRERNNNIHKNARGALKRCPTLNEKVIVYEPDIPRGNWKTATVIKLIKSSDGEIRSVELQFDEGFVTRRAINHLYPLEESTESVDLESNAGGRSVAEDRE